jgi:AcrR family transcriptional regulator
MNEIPTQTQTPPATPARSPRADAARNRARVLAAAKEVFEAEGLSVSVDEIARRAGVGVGTLYRHFPTKKALFEAIVSDDLQSFVDAADRLLVAEHPGEALYSFLMLVVDHSETSAAIKDALGGVYAIDRYAHDIVRAIEDAVARMLERAQAAGEARNDVTAPEVLALIAAVYHSAPRTERGGVSCSKLVAVICDGLRTVS